MVQDEAGFVPERVPLMKQTHSFQTTYELDDLEGIAQRIAAHFKPGDRIGLCGPLGAGKTSLVGALCAAMGVLPYYQVQSPTFSLVQDYQTKAGIPIFHADLYRLASLQEWEELELFELAAGGILFVEWADKFKDLRNDFNILLELSFDSPTRRVLTLCGNRPFDF